jgi:2-polyprenyl-6-methoxyphenol hydroxylase-like FAD-dependent oxidoreductase
MADILVIGAGICGLGSALLLARDGHHVTVIERDQSALPDSPTDAWDAWTRRGVAQFWQPHNFMPGMRLLLEAELPDVQETLRAAGAMKLDFLHPHPFEDKSSRPIDDKLWTYTTRRPLGEWVFAKRASEERGVTIRRGVRVAGLVAGPAVVSGVPHVVRVRTTDGEELSADLVVDATGRGSRGPTWLEALGARKPYEEAADSGFTYYTRYFSGNEPERILPGLVPYGTISVLTLPGDNQTWSVTVFASSGDTALKGLRETEKWTRTVRALPLQAHWLNGEPITDVLAMSGVVDRYRRLVVDGSPVATGFVCVADALACTNPSAGRGMTVGMIHARHLRDAVREGLDDPLAFALRFDAVTQREIAPWYQAQIALDRYRFAEMECLREGRDPPAPSAAARPIVRLFAVLLADVELLRAALEYICTVTPIQRILERADVIERISVALKVRRDAPPVRAPGPDRAQLLELVS